MTYKKTDWVEYETLVSASNLNKIEDQLQTISTSTELNEMAIKSTDPRVKDLSKNLQVTTETVALHKSETANQLMQQTAEINRLRKINNKQNKEIAYLKLKQEANDRIEGGTIFADDMAENRFGIEFNSGLSENVLFKDGSLTMNSDSSAKHNVDGSVVVEGSSYFTRFNAGRKLVRLENDTLVCVVATDTEWGLRKSVDGGKNWTDIYSLSVSRLQDVCIQTNGTYVYVLCCYNNTTVSHYVLTENGNLLESREIQTEQIELGTCSLAINSEGTEIHACWESKDNNIRFPHIQYLGGTIDEDGLVEWENFEYLGEEYSSYTNPTIALNDFNDPIVCCVRNTSSLRAFLFKSLRLDDMVIILDMVYASYPSAIFVPKSVNGLACGRIWVAWHYRDIYSGNKGIRVSYSDDNGATWVNIEKVIGESTYDGRIPSITANKNNEIFVTWSGGGLIKWKDGTWGEIEDDDKGFGFPSTLYDVKWNTDFTKPLLAYTKSNSINFTGSWTTGGCIPATEATVVYKLPSTDYVGLFVQKEGNINIEATINDVPMDSELNGNEYQFTKALDDEEPVTLKLSLSRENTTNGDNDKVTRILGGIS